MIKKLYPFLPYLIALGIFIFSIYRVPHYGMNWDSPVHFARGQAILHYLLTGRDDYTGLPSFCMNNENLNSRKDAKTGEICDRHRKVRVSEYQSILLDFKFFKKDTYGHPPFSDIMLAVTNRVFYIYLGWFDDIPAYHLYNVFTAFLLAVTVASWLKRTGGIFAAIVGVIIIYLFPLLLGEQHFNVKDPPMAAFFTLSMYFFWLAITEKKAWYLILSAIVAGFSFATKFNFVFAPFILFPWMLLITIPTMKATMKKYGMSVAAVKKVFSYIPWPFYITIPLYPVIIFAVFFLTWPSLWSDPVKNVLNVFQYYQDIGTQTCEYSKFTLASFIHCTNPISLQYFLYTMPLVSLFFFSMGLFFAIKHLKAYNYVFVLWLSFFLVTILRVTLPIASVYGGIRQILEFIGPFALIGAFGALFFRDIVRAQIIKRLRVAKRKQYIVLVFSSLLVLSFFIPITIKMAQMHPHENVYFNPLIGGLKGAAEQKFPGFGNTYGNGYYDGIKWLNENAEPNAKVALLTGSAQNIWRASLHERIAYGNVYRSGYNQDGEYLLFLITQGDQFTNIFRVKFADTFLVPVYELKVDDVVILKIWKNDKKNTKPGIDIQTVIKEEITIEKKDAVVQVALSEIVPLRSIAITSISQDCRDAFLSQPISLSEDGESFRQLPDLFENFTTNERRNYTADYVSLIAGDKAKYIYIAQNPEKNCNLEDFSVEVFSLPRK